MKFLGVSSDIGNHWVIDTQGSCFQRKKIPGPIINAHEVFFFQFWDFPIWLPPSVFQGTLLLEFSKFQEFPVQKNATLKFKYFPGFPGICTNLGLMRVTV